jgi:acyl-CoA synthetase (AMP-forming)/AMP-acid ligase II
MIEWLGPIIEEYYSGSEGIGIVTINSEQWLKKPGSVGRPLMGEIHICDEGGVELPPGQDGIIYFGGGLSFTYHNDASKTASARNPLRPDWSTLGDIGRVDEDGYLFLSDRRDFMIISGGVNIYPQELENIMIMHPDVVEVAVFGVPNSDFGEEVKAVVQPRDWSQATPAFAQQLMAWCREQISDLKCPRSIDFEKALVRTETGKLLKKELRARYWK